MSYNLRVRSEKQPSMPDTVAKKIKQPFHNRAIVKKAAPIKAGTRFTRAEDDFILKCAEEFAEEKKSSNVVFWEAMSYHMGRTEKALKQRYYTYLRDGNKTGPWSDEETSQVGSVPPTHPARVKPQAPHPRTEPSPSCSQFAASLAKTGSLKLAEAPGRCLFQKRAKVRQIVQKQQRRLNFQREQAARDAGLV